jgi:hypothetical protein
MSVFAFIPDEGFVDVDVVNCSCRVFALLVGGMGEGGGAFLSAGLSQLPKDSFCWEMSSREPFWWRNNIAEFGLNPIGQFTFPKP